MENSMQHTDKVCMKFNKIKVILVCGVLVLSACSTIPITEQGMKIRQTTPELTANCRFLGIVGFNAGFGWTHAHEAQNILNKIRNRVAEVGGNAYVLTQETDSIDSVGAQADMYNCPNLK